MKDERRKMKEKINKIQLRLSGYFSDINKKEVKQIRAMYNIELHKSIKNVEDFYKIKLQAVSEELFRLQEENKDLRNNYKLYKELKTEHERIASVIDTKYLRHELNRFLTIIDQTKDKIELLEYRDNKLKIPLG